MGEKWSAYYYNQWVVFVLDLLNKHMNTDLLRFENEL